VEPNQLLGKRGSREGEPTPPQGYEPDYEQLEGMRLHRVRSTHAGVISAGKTSEIEGAAFDNRLASSEQDEATSTGITAPGFESDDILAMEKMSSRLREVSMPDGGYRERFFDVVPIYDDVDTHCNSWLVAACTSRHIRLFDMRQALACLASPSDLVAAIAEEPIAMLPHYCHSDPPKIVGVTSASNANVGCSWDILLHSRMPALFVRMGVRAATDSPSVTTKNPAPPRDCTLSQSRMQGDEQKDATWCGDLDFALELSEENWTKALDLAFAESAPPSSSTLVQEAYPPMCPFPQHGSIEMTILGRQRGTAEPDVVSCISNCSHLLEIRQSGEISELLVASVGLSAWKLACSVGCNG